jgi:hypothetical protein
LHQSISRLTFAASTEDRMADVDDADLESSELSPAIMTETGNLKKSVRFPEQLVAEVPFVKTFHPLESQRTI